MHILRRGFTGNEVKTWQEFLVGQKVKCGNADYTGPVDGVFGPNTELATMDFQEKYVRPALNQAPDGVVGYETIEAAVERGFRLEHSFWLSLGWAYAMRWCIIAWALLWCFPIFGCLKARTMVEGAFDVTWYDMFFVSLVVYVLCFCIQLLSAVLAAYGSERFEMPRPRWLLNARRKKSHVIWYAFSILSGMPTILFCLKVSGKTAQGEVSWGKVALFLLMALLGLLAAYALFTLTLLIHSRGIKTPDEASSGEDDIYEFGSAPVPERVKDQIKDSDHKKPFAILNGPTEFICNIITYVFGNTGYRNVTTGKVKSGHRLLLLMAGIVSLIYWSFCIVRYQWNVPAPTLVYLTLLVTGGVWWFTAMSFALDRFRIPLLLPLGTLVILSQFYPWTQYRFEAKAVAPSTEVPEPAAVDLLDPALEAHPIIVSAEGGGIHSGAWTAHVLGVLEEQIRQETKGQNESFAKHIVCVSGVSGGSYGLMYWVDSYGRPGGPIGDKYSPTITRELTVDRAMRSSLDSAIFGLTYHDVWNSLVPFPGKDRGSALEETWAAPPEDKNIDYTKPLADSTMNGWLRDTKDHLRPAVFFNSMNATNGQPVVFSTAALPGPVAISPPWDYRHQRPDEDVPVVTAARCSASFPYVCPAATPKTDAKGVMHLVDGGYFDNYGMATINRWLSQAAKGWEAMPQKKPHRLLVIQIRDSSETLFSQLQSPTWSTDGHSGSLYQLVAPIAGLYNMRGAAQTWHNDQEFELMVRRFKEKYDIEVRTAVFWFPSLDPALSWHLTDVQKQEILNENFAVPDKVDDPKLAHAPKTEEEIKKWNEWTRFFARDALVKSKQEVLEHLRATASTLAPAPGAPPDKTK